MHSIQPNNSKLEGSSRALTVAAKLQNKAAKHLIKLEKSDFKYEHRNLDSELNSAALHNVFVYVYRYYSAVSQITVNNRTSYWATGLALCMSVKEL